MVFSLIQILRFVAAILVLLFHLELVPSGYKGVDVFFVISGFVMYYTLFYNDPPNAVRFVWHRLSKIFFLYWLSLAVLYSIHYFSFDQSTLKAIFLVPGHESLLGVSWSLSYELYFYLFAGLIAYLVPRKFQMKLILLCFLVAGGISIYNVYGSELQGTMLNFLLGAHFWQFTFGIFAGYMAFFTKYLIPNRIGLIGVLLSCAALMGIQYLYEDQRAYLVYGLLAFFLVMFTLLIELQKKLPEGLTKFCNLLGDASYAMYLFGPLVAMLLPTEGIQAKLLVILVTVLLSIGINRLIEKPILTLLRFKSNTHDTPHRTTDSEEN